LLFADRQLAGGDNFALGGADFFKLVHRLTSLAI
jgi:hypothetical protein